MIESKDLKEGQKVIIVANDSNHDFKIEDEVEITYVGDCYADCKKKGSKLGWSVLFEDISL